jgi:hypothetical protein
MFSYLAFRLVVGYLLTFDVAGLHEFPRCTDQPVSTAIFPINRLFALLPFFYSFFYWGKALFFNRK